MKLELANFPVNDVRFSNKTSYNKGVLEVDEKELVALVLDDKRIVSADLDIAFPNEQTRIFNIIDAVEPRVKVSGPGCVFPGILGPVETAGQGRTHRLSGVTVIPSVQYKPTTQEGPQREGISGVLDMWGLGSLRSPFGSTINIVLILNLINGVTEGEAHASIQMAEFKVARLLAETTRGITPESMEVLELGEVDPSLPRVAYILTFMTLPEMPHSGVAYYGLPVRESLATLIHPNEFFDGAVTVGGAVGHALTWEWMNQPILLELIREHGKQLNFVGTILQRTRFRIEHGKYVTAEGTAEIAKLLGADGVIITLVHASGNNFMDVMFTVQACEKKGIKTVLMTTEWGSDETETPLVFYAPEATAMVSTGSRKREIKLPAPAKVIGVKEGEFVTLVSPKPVSPWSELTLNLGTTMIAGGVPWFGGGHYTCQEF